LAVAELLAAQGAGVVVNGRDNDAVKAASTRRRCTRQIFIAAGGFVGRFDRPTPTVIGYRNHHDSLPWALSELQHLLG
jgi:hypothetical protein